MLQAISRIRAAFVSLPARATLLLLAFVSAGILVMGGVGYFKLDQSTRENADIRIDRAARAAAAIAARAFEGVFSIEREADGRPLAVRLAPNFTSDALKISPKFDALVDEIAKTNQGSANVFRYNSITGLFERFATTLRKPDGTLARNASLGKKHAAYSSLVAGKHYTGRVQVLERDRLAYLTPILDASGTVAGALAVDVGWVDDLLRAKTELQHTIFVSTGLLLFILISLGAVLLHREFRPLRVIGAFAHRIAIGEVRGDVPFLDRKDEIGTLAAGMAQVVNMQAKLEQLAYFDQLTGAANRSRFQRALEICLGGKDEPVVPSSLYFIDLDQFKEVNDAFGHEAGDALIVKVAELLRQELKPGEMLARIGGDEFAILSPSRLAIDDIVPLADTILNRLARPFNLPQGEVHTGCSIGIALLPQDGRTTQDAIRNVDLALYEAKKNGRGRFCFFANEMNEAAQKRLVTGRALREAIEAKELIVHFQPQVRISDFSLFGVEALARWPHPTRGFIPPSEFIPIAEDSGLIVDLGVLVLNETCRCARQWLDAGFDFRSVSVNVSPIQLWQPNFEQVVAAALAESGLPPRHLCLEVTESLFVNHGEERVLRTLNALRDLGVSLSLDDFGTGYSSLGYLNKLPFNQIKIDRSFVADIDKDEQKERLLRGIVALGKGLGFHLIAEGAETEAEVAILRAAGCDAVQGFYFSRPVAALMVPVEADSIRHRTYNFDKAGAKTAPIHLVGS